MVERVLRLRLHRIAELKNIHGAAVDFAFTAAVPERMTCQKILLCAIFGVCLFAGVMHFRPMLASSRANSPSADDFHDDKSMSDARHGAEMSPGSAISMEKSSVVDPTSQESRLANSLLDLCQAENFPAALKMALEAPPELRNDFVKAVFNRWGRIKPQAAMKSLETIADPQLRSTAMRAAADGWNANDPAGLAAYAFALPQDDDRDYALGLALDNWSMQDPAALGTWLNTLPRGPEFDYGVALMIAKSDSVNRTPELAMQWVENIGDAALKLDLTERVLREWSQSDATAAQRYVADAAWLDDSQRREIFSKVFAVR